MATQPANPRKANGHRRRQVTDIVYAEEHDCWICGNPVDKTLPYLDPQTGKPHPWAKTVDEIVPVSTGQTPQEQMLLATTRSNCRLAHRRCNIQRGNGTRAAHVSGPAPLKRVRSY
jgi:5-methylcytosine-specific restriction endonuclease McrA